MAPKPPLNNFDLDLMPDQTVSFSETAFDNFIRSQGIELIHYTATRCPVGLIDQDDVTRRPHEDHEGCSNGFIYTQAGIVTGLFYSNSLSLKMTDVGRADAAGVQVTLPRFYDTPDCGGHGVTNACDDGQYSGIPLLVAPFDRFYIKEEAGLEVVHWQLNQVSGTSIDRLSFPAKKVTVLVDNQGHRYHYGSDFSLTSDGWIKWVPNHSPGVDPKTNKGRVYSIRYTYRPYFYVERLPHEIRVAQIQDDATGQRHVERMPQTIILQREYSFYSQGDDRQQNASSARMPRLPSNGNSFGPR